MDDRRDIEIRIILDDSINHVQEIYSNYEESQFLLQHLGVTRSESVNNLQE